MGAQGRGEKKKNQSISSPSSPSIGGPEGRKEIQDGHRGTSCKRTESFLCQRAQQTFLNNVINHGHGSLSPPHKDSKHTNNYTVHCNLAQRKVCLCFPLLPSGRQHHHPPFFLSPSFTPPHNNKITFALAVREFGWMIY